MNIIPSTVLISFIQLSPYKESLMWSQIFQIQTDIFHIQITINTSGKQWYIRNDIFDEFWRANWETEFHIWVNLIKCFLFFPDD